MSKTSEINELYPAIEPYHSEVLRVSEIHEVYLEVSGNPDGKPVIFLHGGPGAGTNPSCRRLFDPALYRIVLFDQRGCGKSLPTGCLVDNTTWDLINDMELIRAHLGIKTWQVFGGSWGSTLALAYAINHPQQVTELVLRGIFLLRRKEVLWFYQWGHPLFPDLFEDYISIIPENERDDVVHAYYRRLTSDDQAVRIEAARCWSKWEGYLLSVLPDPETVAFFDSESFAESFARIESHYFENRGFFNDDNYLLDHIHLIRHIPTVIVQGRYDVVTPVETAWDLHKAFPEATLKIIPAAGHAVSEPGIRSALLDATNHYGKLPQG